jgi:hypothetical protein
MLRILPPKPTRSEANSKELGKQHPDSGKLACFSGEISPIRAKLPEIQASNDDAF